MSSDEERVKSDWRARMELTRAFYRHAIHQRKEAEMAKLKQLPLSEIYATQYSRPKSNAAILGELSELECQTGWRAAEAIGSIFE